MNIKMEKDASRAALPVSRLHETLKDQAVAVLCDAFHDYPVMRYVIGPVGGGYDRYLHTLINFFVMARVWRDEPILAVLDGGVPVATAILTLPGKPQPPAELAQLREAVWRELGDAARGRYEAFGEATRKFDISRPHYHLNMIGVRRSHHGKGLSRQLLEAVHTMSQGDPVSCGVTLTTEDSRNISLYEHFGYQLAGHTRVDSQLDTWGFFRPNGDTVCSPGGFERSLAHVRRYTKNYP